MHTRLLALTIAIASGVSVLARQAEPRFEVASVKPNLTPGPIPFRPQPPDGVNFASFSATTLLEFAFDLRYFQMVGLPPWATTEPFEVIAKASHPIDQAERRAMMRTLLAERFGLRAHIEPREQTVSVMTARDRRPGPALTPHADCVPPDCTAGATLLRDRLTFVAGSMPDIAKLLSLVRSQVVVDETGFAGRYDLTLSFRPDQPETGAPDPADPRPAFTTAVEEGLGVKLTTQRRPVETLIVDRIERPTPD